MTTSTTAVTGRSRAANAAWESLLTAHAVRMKDFAADDVWGDVSMKDYDVLYTLAKAGDPLRLTDLHRGVLLSQPALSRLVDRLIARGLVERCPDPGDGRSVRISLTAAGRARQREVGRRHAAAVTAAVTSALDDAEIAALDRICRKLAATPSAHENPAPELEAVP